MKSGDSIVIRDLQKEPDFCKEFAIWILLMKKSTQRIITLKQCARDWIAKHNYGVVRPALELMWRIILDIEREAKKKEGDPMDRANDQYRDFLRGIYWDTFECRRHEWQEQASKLRVVMLGSIIQDWIDTHNEESQQAFRFLIAAYNPLHETRDMRPGEFQIEKKARGKHVSDAEKKEILELVHQRLEYFSSEGIARWLKEPWIPDDITRKLLAARLRIGGISLGREDIAKSELLADLDLENCSGEAIELLGGLAGSIGKAGGACSLLMQEIADLIKRKQFVVQFYQDPEKDEKPTKAEIAIAKIHVFKAQYIWITLEFHEKVENSMILHFNQPLILLADIRLKEFPQGTRLHISAWQSGKRDEEIPIFDKTA